jgi:lauroyl/myristoyl acyltransferase
VPRAQSLRALFRALARDECVVLLGDIAPEGVETAQVPFFGRPAPFPLGPARLAQRTRAPILVISCVRMPDYTYRLEAQPPLRADPTRPADAAVLDLTAAIAARFERLIAAWPEQWYPFHPVWPDQ